MSHIRSGSAAVRPANRLRDEAGMLFVQLATFVFIVVGMALTTMYYVVSISTPASQGDSAERGLVRVIGGASSTDFQGQTRPSDQQMDDMMTAFAANGAALLNITSDDVAGSEAVGALFLTDPTAYESCDANGNPSGPAIAGTDNEDEYKNLEDGILGIGRNWCCHHSLVSPPARSYEFQTTDGVTQAPSDPTALLALAEAECRRLLGDGDAAAQAILFGKGRPRVGECMELNCKCLIARYIPNSLLPTVWKEIVNCALTPPGVPTTEDPIELPGGFYY